MKMNEEELLSLKEPELKKKLSAAAPAITGEYFTPELLLPRENPVRKEVGALRAAWQAKHARLVRLQAFIVPALIFIPAGIALLLKADPRVPAFLFVGIIVLCLIYFWFTGKISTWRSKTLDKHFEIAESESEALVIRRAATWARNRYELPAGKIEWSAYGSEFRLGAGENTQVFKWEEATVTEEGLEGWVIQDVVTGEEPPLKKVPTN
jgi:lipopolysaccharide export LptBFGC system permease protein LptF